MNCPGSDNQVNLDLNVVQTLDFNSKISIITKIIVAFSLYSFLVSIILRHHPAVERNEGVEYVDLRNSA